MERQQLILLHLRLIYVWLYKAQEKYNKRHLVILTTDIHLTYLILRDAQH